MTVPSMEPAGQRSSTVADTVTVLLAGDSRDDDPIEAHFRDDDGFSVRTAPSISDAMDGLDDVDCVVRAHAATDGTDDDPLEPIGQRARDLPIVLLADGRTEWVAALDAIDSHRWADCLERPDSTSAIQRLSRRIRALIEQRRLAELSQRSLAGIELAGDAIGIVDPDGGLEFVNRAFAMQFGYDREALVGRPWQTLFTDDSVDRLETAAIPTVAEGWRWTGTCTGRRKSGTTMPVRVRLGGPENGGLVFVVERVAAADDESD